MPTTVQFRRGTTAQNDNFTGAVGEISVDTTLDQLRLHDGSTQGGFKIGRAVDVDDKMQVANAQALFSTVNANNMSVANTRALVNARLGATASVTLTGDVTGSGSFSSNAVSIALSIPDGTITPAMIGADAITANAIATGAIGSSELASTGTPTGTFGSGSLVPVITVDADGRITNISNTNVAGVTAFSYTSANNTFKIDTADGANFTATHTDFLPTAGGTMSGAIAMGTSKITGLGDPTSAQDAATKNYVDTEVANLVDSAPAALDTLNELAAALGDDANFATTVSTNIGQKLGATASVTLTGDVSGTASFSSNAVSITTVVADDSHNHIISNVDGLQAALDNRMTVANTQALANARLGATASVTLTGDVTGTASFSGNSVSIATTYNNDVVLGTDTSGNYVATITGGTGLTSSGATSGEGIAHSLSVDYGTSAGTACQGNDARLSDSRTCDNTFDNAATARTNLGLGSLATLSTVNAATITDNSVGAAELNVSGNGTTAQFLRSDGDGTFTWATPTDTNTTYSAGSGLDLSGTTFAVEPDLRDGITHVGRDTNDYIAIGTTTIGFFLDGAEDMRLTNNGQLDVEGDVVAHSSTVSDERLKENIEKIENPLDIINGLSGYTFNYKKDGRASAGLIAQEVESVLPSAVKETEILGHDGEYKILEYTQLIGVLVEAMKDQQKQIEELKSKIK